MAVQKAEQKGEENKEIEMVIAMHKDGITNDSIAKIGRIPIEKVDKIIKSPSNTEGGLKNKKIVFYRRRSSKLRRLFMYFHLYFKTFFDVKYLQLDAH